LIIAGGGVVLAAMLALMMVFAERSAPGDHPADARAITGDLTDVEGGAIDHVRRETLPSDPTESESPEGEMAAEEGEPRTVVCVLIDDQTHRPLGGLPIDVRLSGSPAATAKRLVSGGDGRVAVEVRGQLTYRIDIADASLITYDQPCQISYRDQPIELRVSRAGRVAGRVIDEQGAPLANVAIHAWAITAEAHPEWLRIAPPEGDPAPVARTDREGRFELPPIHQGCELGISARDPDHAPAFSYGGEPVPPGTYEAFVSVTDFAPRPYGTIQLARGEQRCLEADYPTDGGELILASDQRPIIARVQITNAEGRDLAPIAGWFPRYHLAVGSYAVIATLRDGRQAHASITVRDGDVTTLPLTFE
jgi:hypothetical protein